MNVSNTQLIITLKLKQKVVKYVIYLKIVTFVLFVKTSSIVPMVMSRMGPEPVSAGSLESANQSILAACNLFKDFGEDKIKIL